MNTQDFNAIVLCAGLGTRLRPLTNAMAKPSVPVGPVPAALRNIEQLLSFNIPVVHCNTHYLAEDLEMELLAACQSRGIPAARLRFWNEPELLETGGGIARIAKTLANESNPQTCKDTLVVSGDIVADIPLAKMMSAWRARKESETALMVTLPLDRPRKDVTWVDEVNRSVVGFGADWDSEIAGGRGYSPRVFSNHQIISGTILQNSRLEKKSSIDIFYRQAIRDGESIIHVPFESDAHWFDIGTPETYLKCISKLDHDLPERLEQLGSSMINLCTLDHTGTDGSATVLNNPNHVHSRSAKKKFAEHCLSKISQGSTTQWLWIGTIHSLPSVFHSGLLNLARCFSVRPEGESQHAEGSSNLPLAIHALQGGLQRLLASSLAQISRDTSLDTAGFIDLPRPQPLSTHPLFQAPLLVPLDLLLNTGGLSQLASNEAISPFWILVTPPRQ